MGNPSAQIRLQPDTGVAVGRGCAGDTDGRSEVTLDGFGVTAT